jgi:hypothetical protein
MERSAKISPNVIAGTLAASLALNAHAALAEDYPSLS